MPFVDPLTDWGFKRLFGSEFNKEVLIVFFNALFPEKDITDLDYLSMEGNKLVFDKKNVIL